MASKKFACVPMCNSKIAIAATTATAPIFICPSMNLTLNHRLKCFHLNYGHSKLQNKCVAI